MSTKRFNAIKSLTADELATKIRETESEVFKARMQRVTGQLKNTSSIWLMRKDLARMKMIVGRPKAVKAQAPAKVQEKR